MKLAQVLTATNTTQLAMGAPQGRTPVKGKNRSAKKFKRASFTQSEKLHAIALVRTNGMAAAIRELFPGLHGVQEASRRRQLYR